MGHILFIKFAGGNHPKGAPPPLESSASVPLDRPEALPLDSAAFEKAGETFSIAHTGVWARDFLRFWKAALSDDKALPFAPTQPPVPIPQKTRGMFDTARFYPGIPP